MIDEAAVRLALGRAKVFHEVAARTATPGVATGLAVTGVGGDVLFVEAASMTGKGGLVLTGQLGDVMKESARIALTYVRSHAARLGIRDEAFAGKEFHLHVPAGAVPKDGPSAGVTLVTALASLLTQRPVKSTVGMTGEVTLQGRVLPIGGLKQKVLAAHAAGLTEVILPARNAPDLDDVPADVRDAHDVPPGEHDSTRCSRSRSTRIAREGRVGRPIPPAAIAEELLHDGPRFCREDAGDDAQPVIERRVLVRALRGLDRAGLGLGRAEHQRVDPRVNHRAHAHETRLDREYSVAPGNR